MDPCASYGGLCCGFCCTAERERCLRKTDEGWCGFLVTGITPRESGAPTQGRNYGDGNSRRNHKDTHRFSTEDASGSTSQAAGIVEGMESGNRVFLLDEDTSATNFMVRDAFMQKVVSPDKEPITPFLSRARDLYEKADISTILVAGSSGAFFHIADTVIQMDSYVPIDITKKAKALCKEYPVQQEAAHAFAMPQNDRIMTIDQNGATRRRDYRSGRVRTDEPERLKLKFMGKEGFALGRQNVDLRYIEQIVDAEQTASLGLLLKYVDDCLTMPHELAILKVTI